MRKTQSPSRQILGLAGFVLVTFCAPLAGIFATPDQSYAALNKPA